MRSLEWVGHSSVFADPRVEYNLAIGAYSREELRILRIAARRRIRRVNKSIVRELRPDSPDGLSQFYRFGPSVDAYVQQVTDNDARVILAHPKLRYEFVDMTDEVPLGPRQNRPLSLPDGEIIEVRDVEEFGSFTAFERAR